MSTTDEPTNYVMPTGPEMTALRKVLTRMAGYDPETEDVPLDDIQLATEAAERFVELADRIERIEQVVDTDLDALAYEQMTKRDKVREVRSTMIRQARQGGRASLTYDAVRSIFGGRPSPGHAYDLMRAAAEAEGFDYQDRADRDNRIVVKLDAVKDEALIRAANNEPPEQPA